MSRAECVYTYCIRAFSFSCWFYLRQMWRGLWQQPPMAYVRFSNHARVRARKTNLPATGRAGALRSGLGAVRIYF